MQYRFLLILTGLSTGSLLSYAAADPAGHGGHSHGGGHGHHMAHSIRRSESYGHEHLHFHTHYHNHYGHDNNYGNSNRYGSSSVYTYPLRDLNEITAGAGLKPVNELEDSAAKTATPGMFLTYRHYVTNGFALGFTAGFQDIYGSGMYDNGSGQPMPFTYAQLNTTFAAEMTWLYASRRDFMAYGSFGAGITHWLENGQDQDNTKYTEEGDKFGFQFSPLCFRIGRSVGAFAEFGVGYKGLFNGGLSYQPGWKKTHPFYNSRYY